MGFCRCCRTVPSKGAGECEGCADRLAIAREIPFCPRNFHGFDVIPVNSKPKLRKPAALEQSDSALTREPFFVIKISVKLSRY